MKTQVELIVDDLDARSANFRDTQIAIEEIHFSIMGECYEIHLGQANAAKLRELFAPYIASGRVTAVERPGPKGKHRKSEPRPDNAAIRQWGIDHGYDVPSKGRIPLRVITEYDAAKNAENVISTARGSKKGQASRISLAS